MLQILPPNIANLIAAGEVVQRPASVVKELVENSIDAGASNITVIIEDSGRTLIQVIDDGCGMSAEDARLCFERHATSKIASAGDLERIITYGFRGEALASIAAVAEITLKTRQKGTDMGTVTDFCESRFVGQEVAIVPEGTNISVRNLFYNIPARRKFLKSEKAEFRNIVAEFSRIAISHHNVSFSLIHNSKDVFKLSATTNLKKRIIDIIGKSISKALVEAGTDTPIVKISGFIGCPEEARKGLGNQYLFVNGRFFRSAYLHKAITKSYENLIQDGYTPSYFLFFEVDPSAIDVNISPTKTEVKFENEVQIFEILNAVTREALGKNAFTPSIDFDTEGAPEIPIALKGQYVPPPKMDFDPLFNPFESSSFRSGSGYANPVSDNTRMPEGSFNLPEEDFEGTSSFPLDMESGQFPEIQENDYSWTVADETEDGIGLFDNTGKCNTRIIQIQGKYLVTALKSGMMIVHIHRAMKRIYYERYLKSLDNSQAIANQTLFPVAVELDYNTFSILTEYPGRTRMLGFELEPDNDNRNTIVVHALPDGYSSDQDCIKEYLDNLAVILSENDSESMIKAQCRHDIALRMSENAANKNIGILSDLEAQALIDGLFACGEPDRSPEGHPTMSIININQIDKLL